jgi:D-alanyl-D-alanine carboxypeptidase
VPDHAARSRRHRVRKNLRYGSILGEKPARTLAVLGAMMAAAAITTATLFHPIAQATEAGNSPKVIAPVEVSASDPVKRTEPSANRGQDKRLAIDGSEVPTSDRGEFTLKAAPPGKSPKDGAIGDTAGRARVLTSCSGVKPKGSVANGKLPASSLCDVGQGHQLRADAAESYAKMNAAYKKDTGKSMVLTDTYRTYASQVDVRGRKPGLAAVPGTSLHGLGIAIDFGGGAASASGPMYQWLVKNAGKFGWENPDWAKGSKYEPWHWEYVPARDK